MQPENRYVTAQRTCVEGLPRLRRVDALKPRSLGVQSGRRASSTEVRPSA